MDLDCIIHIFKVTDSTTKIAFSITSKYIYYESQKHIQYIKSAIQKADIFSIINFPRWYNFIDSYTIGKISSKILCMLYIKYSRFNANSLFQGISYSGNIELIKYLLNRNIKCTSWNSCLSEACMGNHLEMVKFIIKNGANRYSKSLEIAYRINNQLIIELLIECGGNNLDRALTGAVLGGHMELILNIIKQGAIVQNTTLRSACENGNMEIIQLLIDRGVDNWDYGLEGACAGGHITIAKQMIQLGATDYNTGIIVATVNGHTELVRLMIEHGADRWSICLKMACWHDYIEIVKLILKYNTTDLEECLHYACSRGNEDIVRLLIHYGFRGKKYPKCIMQYPNILEILLNNNITICYECEKLLTEH